MRAFYRTAKESIDMTLGYTLLALALALTVGANVLWTMAQRKGAGEAFASWARWCVLGGAASVIAASGYLMTLIAGHHFEVAYVAEYSAKRSAPAFLWAAFWGGQEGSILLWTFWTAVLGVVLAYRGGSRTSRVWPIFGIVQVFLLCLLLMKCPFALGSGPVPADGRGLNPLLENMWMVIHPPILFLGFASLLAPFAWCVYGLVYRDWDGWARAAFSWALFAFAALGLGLSLGGYWAYETLGWGGFWGWDPVENSSLVPWLFITALLHGIAIQNKNGGYKVTNFVLGFLPFVAMSYGTFLTRTGLLSDFSVHSFSSLGPDGYWMMLSEVLASLLIPTLLLVLQFRSIPKPAAYERVATREFGYFLASSLLGLLGLLVAVGMSAPLITRMWLPKGAAAQPEFYNQGGYPLVILLTLAMAATPYVAWKAGSEQNKDVLRRLTPSYFAAIGLAMAMTVAAILMGIRQPWMILMFATALFAVIANIALVIPRLPRRESRLTVGGFVAHAGAGLVLAGIACLVAFSQRAERVLLIKNVPETKLGYKLTYRGETSQPFDRDHNALRIEVEKSGRIWEARPRYYFAPWENKDTLFANPPAILPSVYNLHGPADLVNLLPWRNPFAWGDLYIAYSGGPMGLDNDKSRNPNNGFTLAARETKTVGDYTFTLRNLQLDDKARAAQEQTVNTDGRNKVADLPYIMVQAQVDVTYQGRTETVMPQLKLEQAGGVFALPAAIPGPDGQKVVLKLEQPGEGQTQMKALSLRTVNAPDPTEAVLIDLSTKPFIGLVWAGTLLYTLGGLIAYRRRAIETGLLEKPARKRGKA